jgi:hypothetical protein
MTTWKITNATKKNAVEIQFWTKNGVTVKKVEGYRWGTWFCDSDEQPDIDLNNPDGYELGFADYDWEMEEMIDGSWMEWEFPDELSQEERDAIEAAWDENWYEGMEELGWYNEETEQWIYGPIKLINEDTGEEFEGKESYELD